MTSISVTQVDVGYPLLTDKHYSLKHTLFGFGDNKLAGKAFVIKALKGINLEVKSGQRVGLIGANGAGKSTLLRVLAGVYPPSKGLVQIEGRVTSLLDLAVGVDMDLSGWENIRVRLLLLGFRDDELRDCTLRAGEFSELGQHLDLPVRTYSTGMFVRLAFSVCTVVEPEILLLDEFLSAGDLHFVTKAQKKVDQLMEKGAIVVVASHSLAEVRRICTHCLWLEKGVAKMFGNATDVVDAYELSALAG